MAVVFPTNLSPFATRYETSVVLKVKTNAISEKWFSADRRISSLAVF